MNKVQFHIKENGEWVKLNATPVFPFSVGELLDERLDEAYVTVYDSPVEHYARLTDVRATIYNGTNEPKAEYFIIASDTSIELPAGSGKYKHDIYLIERTKMLEGVYCSSITFTNSKGNVYVESTDNPLVTPTGLGIPYVNYLMKLQKYVLSTSYTFPSLDAICTYYDNGVPKNVFIDQMGFEAVVPVDDDETRQSSIVLFNNYTNTQTADFYCTNTQDLRQPLTINDIPGGIYDVRYTFVVKYGSQYTSFTVTYRIIAVHNRLPLKRWSITDCVIRACELAEPLIGTQAPKYRLDGVTYDASGNVITPYPSGSLAERYDKEFAPEMTLTQDNLREQLRLIFSNVHAEPWIDENDIIHVTEYGGVTPSPSAELPYVYSAGKSHINEYCTEIRSHAQNLASSLGYAKGTMIDPGNGLFRSVRTDVAYARINETNGIAETPQPIYTIDKVLCGIAPANKSPGMTWWLDPVEITPYVFESTEYSANLSPYKGGFPYSRAYAIYYTMGQPNIQGLFYQAPDAVSNAANSPFSIANILSAVTGRSADTIYDYLKNTVGGAADLVFSITYKPISNHFVSHGKSLYVPGEKPYMQLYNQTENLVESQAFGQLIKGVAYRLGNVEEERTYILKDINDIPKVGQMLDEYAITTVSSEIFPFDIKCTVGLSKDFNALSSYIGINSAKRMYEISERQSTQRDILIKETLVIGKKPTGYTNAGKIFNTMAPFFLLFHAMSSTANGNYRISFATLRTKKKNGTTLYEVSLPVIGRALGNVLTFNFATKDNYSAGNSTLLVTGNNEIEGRWQTDAPYTDYYGRAWWADLFLKTKYNGTLDDNIRDPFILPQAVPSATQQLFLKDHRLRKDNRESLSYNIELEIKTTDPDLIIGTALAEYCGWVSDTNVNPVLYLVDTSTHLVSKFEHIFTPGTNDINRGTYRITADDNKWSAEIDANDGTLTLNIVNPTEEGYGWVICTPIENVTELVENDDGETVEITYQTGGEILLASNKPLTKNVASDVTTRTTSYDFYVEK